MDFKTVILSFFSSLIIVLQRIVLLILYPYKSMRRISRETDHLQIVIIFSFILVYFYFANELREYTYEPIILFILTVFHYIASVFFFYFIGTIFNKSHSIQLKPYLFTLAYTFIPTLVWFGTNSVLYAILPPPRNLTMLGTAFSVVYVSFCVAVFLWKLILEYLALRFSSEQPFYRIIYMLLLYIALVGPYFFMMYVMGFFRVPFI